MSFSPVRKHSKASPTREGAGVRLHRGFGFGETDQTDPFLLFDDFRGDREEDYIAGFPWHPHRGIETVTYVLAGTVDHGDSLGNSGSLGAGSIQWMTAGSGIIHQEMPHGDELGRMHGFQLWANLPRALKMTDPRYQDVPATEVPERHEDDGTTFRVLCGEYGGISGPVDGIAAAPRYMDITVPAGRTKTFRMDVESRAFAYVFEGSGTFRGASDPQPVPYEVEDDVIALKPVDVDNRSLVIFDAGDEVRVTAAEDGLRFLLVSGRPIREPVAWYGPIVMNTQEELQTAFDEFRRGAFIRKGAN
ncbi:MAG: pirin family protein [Spirochaetaceae bacterium]|nr:MAG: pirin family protein [Spirochaetaceae bacterium]